MLAVSLKWRLGVVRRRPKGTGVGGARSSPAACLGAGWLDLDLVGRQRLGIPHLGIWGFLPCPVSASCPISSGAVWVLLQF